MAHPVILLIDNDSGADEIYDAVKKITKTLPNKAAPFLHIVGNLYVVATPFKPGNQPSAMEDFFDDQTKGMPHHGKTFNPDKSMDPTKHYGKVIFSQLVEQHASKIDFSGFCPILDRLTAVIAAHAGKLPATVPSQSGSSNP